MEVIKNPFEDTSRNPLAISSSKYKKIISTINGENLAQEETDQEKSFKEYLKLRSEEMVVKWSGSFKRAQEQSGKKKFADKALKGKPEQLHRESIATAVEFPQKAKPVPKESQSAEIQKTSRAFGRNFDKKLEKTLTKSTAEDHYQIDCNNQYKAELLSDFYEKCRMKAEHSIIDIIVKRRVHETCIKVIIAEIEKQQNLVFRKALETMMLFEQSKAQKLSSIVGNDKLRIDRNIETRQDHGTHNTINTQTFIAIQPNTRKTGEERLRKNIRAIQLQFSGMDGKKIQCSRQGEFRKMQNHCRDLHTQNESPAKEPLFALPNRLRNNEANENHYLTDQFKQNKQMEVEGKAFNFKPTNRSFEKEDKFLNCVKKLVPNAIKTKPPHLESDVRIGVNAPPQRDKLMTVWKYEIEELKKLNPYKSRLYK